jgi:hypothetical protein
MAALPSLPSRTQIEHAVWPTMRIGAKKVDICWGRDGCLAQRACRHANRQFWFWKEVGYTWVQSPS